MFNNHHKSYLFKIYNIHNIIHYAEHNTLLSFSNVIVLNVGRANNDKIGKYK